MVPPRTNSAVRAGFVLLAAVSVPLALAIYGSANWILFERSRAMARVLAQGTTNPDQITPQAWAGYPAGFDALWFEQAEQDQFHLLNVAPGIPQSLSDMGYWSACLLGVWFASMTGAFAGAWFAGLGRWHRSREIDWRGPTGRGILSALVYWATLAILALPVLAVPTWYVCASRANGTYNTEYIGGWPHGVAPYLVGASALAATSAALGAVCWNRRSAALAMSELRCRACGYRVDSHRAERCPECGTPIIVPAPKREAAAPSRGSRIRGIALALALAGCALAVGALALVPESVRGRVVDWFRVRPSGVVPGEGVILVRPDEVVFIRWRDGCGILYLEQPAQTMTGTPGAGAVVVRRHAAAFWPDGTRFFDIDHAQVVFGSCASPPGATHPLEVPVGPHTVVFTVQPERYPNEFRSLRHRGAIDAFRIFPYTGSNAALQLVRRCQEVSTDPARALPAPGDFDGLAPR